MYRKFICLVLLSIIAIVSHINCTRACVPSKLLVGMRHTTESLTALSKTFWEVADPKSSEFRKFKTIQELSSIVSVPESTILLTKNWLQTLSGVKMDTVTISQMGDSLTVDYDHCQNLYKDTLKAPKVPTPLKENVIDYVIVVAQGKKVQKPRLSRDHTLRAGGMGPVAQREAYGIPPTLRGTNPNNLQMVWGTGTFGYVKEDLDIFFNTYCGEAKCSTKDVMFDESNVWKGDKGKNFVEGTLDASYISAMAPGVRTLVANTNISAATEKGEAFGAALLQFLVDLSAREDAKLPKVLSMSLGSLAFGSCDKVCKAVEVEGKNTYKECWNFLQTQFQACMFQSAEQEARIEVEFQKLGLRGMTITAASGDGGSHFAFGPFNGNLASTINRIICKTMHMPVYPTMSPYVLSIGGTAWQGETSYGPTCSKTTPCGWSRSGGGFSWNIQTPPYQNGVLEDYVKRATEISSKIMPNSTTYNVNGRGYPDISALATFGIPLCTYGGCSGSGGTSASAPTVAAMISLINDSRLNQGKGPVGFINTVLYQAMIENKNSAYQECFADVAVTKLKSDWDCENFSTCTGCDEKQGFIATPGWDAQTGFGQPKFPGLLKLLG